MKSHGQLTAEIGEHLRKELAPRGYYVVHDHGKKAAHVGKIVSWFGDADAPTYDTELSHLDIAVLDQGVSRAVALIEIEETTDRPKTIVGDVFAVLVGDHISFHGKPLDVNPNTTLIIMVRGPSSHRGRVDQLNANLQALRPASSGKNKAIGVVVDLYSGDAQLETKLRTHREAAIARSITSPA